MKTCENHGIPINGVCSCLWTYRGEGKHDLGRRGLRLVLKGCQSEQRVEDGSSIFSSVANWILQSVDSTNTPPPCLARLASKGYHNLLVRVHFTPYCTPSKYLQWPIVPVGASLICGRQGAVTCLQTRQRNSAATVRNTLSATSTPPKLLSFSEANQATHRSHSTCKPGPETLAGV